MGPENFGNFWIFPLVMMIFCMIMMFGAFTFFRRSGGPPWMQSGRNDHSEHQQNSSSGGETPLEILQRRYANGEISKAEFDEMKRDLS